MLIKILDMAVNSKIEKKCSYVVNDLIQHPVGRALNSDWFVGSFMMGVYKYIF